MEADAPLSLGRVLFSLAILAVGIETLVCAPSARSRRVVQPVHRARAMGRFVGPGSCSGRVTASARVHPTELLHSILASTDQRKNPSSPN
jgi:hypothetical protein